MKKLVGTLVSVHTGNNEDYSKEAQPSAQVELDGFVGDKHRGFERIAASYDPDPTGTIRRNERQWTGVSLEELAVIRGRLDLKEPLTAATHTTNSGGPIPGKMFPKYAVRLRGVVGVVDVAGTIEAGDPVVVEVSEPEE